MHSGDFLKKVSKIKDKKEAKHAWWKYRRKNNPIDLFNVRFESDRFSNLNFSNIPFRECVFQSCRFFDCDIRKAVFEEVVFRRCTFTNMNFDQTVFRYVRAIDTNFINCVMAESIKEDVSKLLLEGNCEWDASKEIRIAGKKNIQPVSSYRSRAITLYQKRSTTIYSPGVCAICGAESAVLHEYNKTSVGKIRVCRTCQIGLQEKNFGAIDALNHSVQGGGFSPR